MSSAHLAQQVAMSVAVPPIGSAGSSERDSASQRGNSSDLKKAAVADVEAGISDPNVLSACTQMQIVYSELKYTVQVQEKGAKHATPRDILKGLNGVVQPGRLTAVMGASGAGKTTFLNTLAGHNGTATVSGTISVNGEAVDGSKMQRISGFVHQEDVIMDTMTVREALLFAAELKLPRDMPHEEKLRRAMDIADMLNLRKSLDNVVGSSLLKGISGGEKRRLSLGMEMITNPSILFLDEPTSGLDSFTAYKVARILANVAHRYGRTIMCTIHQPSSEVFAIFDDVIVLAEGEVIYHGPVTDMIGYWANQGYRCPNNFNPADFLFMQVLHAGDANGGSDSSYDFMMLGKENEATKAKAKEAESARIRGLISEWQDSERNKALLQSMGRSQTMNHGVAASAISELATFWTQFKLLAMRAQHNAWRNKLIYKGKLAQTVILSIIVGLIYLQIGDDVASVQDREGSLFFIVVQAFFSSLMGMLTIFGAEKAVFQREFESRYYSLASYFTARTVVTLPVNILMPVLASCIMYFMIGYQLGAANFWWFTLILVLVDNTGGALGIFVSCMFNDIGMALTVMPVFMMPLMVFSGFFVNSENLGWWFRWISYISPMRYSFIGLIKNEFEDLTITCNPTESGCTASGTQSGTYWIDLLGFENDGSVGFNAGILALLWGGFLVLAYCALWVGVRSRR